MRCRYLFVRRVWQVRRAVVSLSYKADDDTISIRCNERMSLPKKEGDEQGGRRTLRGGMCDWPFAGQVPQKI